MPGSNLIAHLMAPDLPDRAGMTLRRRKLGAPRPTTMRSGYQFSSPVGDILRHVSRRVLLLMGLVGMALGLMLALSVGSSGGRGALAATLAAGSGGFALGYGAVPLLLTLMDLTIRLIYVVIFASFVVGAALLMGPLLSGLSPPTP